MARLTRIAIFLVFFDLGGCTSEPATATPATDSGVTVDAPTDAGTDTSDADTSDADTSPPPPTTTTNVGPIPDCVDGVSTGRHASVAATEVDACAIVAGCKVRCTNGAPDLTDVVELRGNEGARGAPGGFCARSRTGRISCFGSDLNVFDVPARAEVRQLAVGAGHACMLFADGTVDCFGRNAEGQLGVTGPESRPKPVTIPALSNVTRIAAGSFYTCALVEGGDVRCFGAFATGPFSSTPGTALPSVAFHGASELHALRRTICARLPTEIACAGDEPSFPATADAITGGRCILTGTTFDCGTESSKVTDVVELASGAPCMRRADGSVVCFGYGYTDGPSSSPKTLAFHTDATCVSQAPGTAKLWRDGIDLSAGVAGNHWDWPFSGVATSDGWRLARPGQCGTDPKCGHVLLRVHGSSYPRCELFGSHGPHAWRAPAEWRSSDTTVFKAHTTPRPSS